MIKVNNQIQQTDWRKLDREQRGKLIFQSGRIRKQNDYFVVGSQSSFKAYKVSFNGHEPKCTCPDCQLRKGKCKHIFAVEFYIKRQIDEEGKITETRGVNIKQYSQKWSAYNKSQTNEKIIFMKLLKDLCENIEQPEYKFGRPTLPFADMLFGSVMKVYTGFSLRRFMSDMKIAHDYGLVDNVPCYSSLSNFMNKEEVKPILENLITISSLPLKEIENDFAVDSSGFSTSRYARWFDYKWGKERKYKVWLKAHLISGVKTNIITGVKITEGQENDSPQLKELIKKTAENFGISEVSGDKAYNSRENFKVIEEVGGTPFIPFKKNVTGKRGTLGIWGKMYYYFMYKHEEFLEHYHKRSNSETIFHMIKTKFRGDIKSKKQTGKDFYLNITGLSSIEKVGVAPYVVDGKKEKLYAAIYANIEDKKCASNAINVSKIADRILNESDGSGGGSGNEGGEDDKGDGSEENPYKIYTWTDLNNVRDDLEGHYILMRDLSADSLGYAGVGDNWNPIGKNIIGAGGEQFRGSFNGNFHTIYDLKIDQVTDGIGLFYEINNSNNHIKDLRILNVNLTLPAGTTSGGSYAGILASQIHFGNISNVHVSGSILVGNTAGCLSSIVENTEIVDSSGSCNIRTTRTNAYNQNGGFVSSVGANTHINRCFSNSTQQTSDAGNGGFMAWLGSASNVVINNSYAIGSMSGSGSYTGGFSGPTNGNNVIYNSYARVTMSAGNCFFGSAYSTLPALNSFYDNQVCTSSSGSGGIVGKTTAQMQTKSTFINAGWSDDIWVLEDGEYPKLAWQN